MSDPILCPNAHECKIDGHGIPYCAKCNIVATWFCTKTGEVYTWQDNDAYADGCATLQDEIDEAFDNQYFSGGW